MIEHPDRDVIGVIDGTHYLLHLADFGPEMKIAAELVVAALGVRSWWAGDLSGQKITFHLEDGKVVYVLGVYDPITRMYEAQWPD